MTVYIKNIKTGLVDVEREVKKVWTLEDGKIKTVNDNNSSWLTTSTVYKDSIIVKVEA